MRKVINYFLLIFVLTFLILISYGEISKRMTTYRPEDIEKYMRDHSISERVQEEYQKLEDPSSQDSELSSDDRSVWISYLEWNAYLRSVDDNTSETFETFFQNILDRCKACHIQRVIVQVRPFADSLYPSEYFPWSECISGEQGTDPGYDPLEIMVNLTHKNHMTLEAWINPYRICNEKKWDHLWEKHPAKMWEKHPDTKRYVLLYDHQYYWNPSIPEVREFIVSGVREIIQNYKVDGIHFDDYFYPTFTTENVAEEFDAEEYNQARKSGDIPKNMKIADWRRNQVNELIKNTYQVIKEENEKVTLGVSPGGNLDNLKSDLMNYTDVERWIKEEGYIDYIMPQIYWGFADQKITFDHAVDVWMQLTKNSPVELKVGIQLYKYGETDQSKPEYKELQSADLLQKEILFLREKNLKDYCFFSYQYLDCRNKRYYFSTTEFSERKKEILDDFVKILKK